MPRNLIGDILLNQFRIENYVASGGMATIYRVWDLQRSVPLAMKVLHPELAEDPAFIARFQREAQSLQRLVHPHIVPFYGLYRDSGLTFLLERFIDGPSLDELLRRRSGKPMPVLDALVYFKALYTSLGYAHAQGIVHCDVKPGNVLIDQGGGVYLTDFGISRYMDSSATTSAALGTPLYMAPEQVRGQIATPQTDVYSLGVVMFELLTGRRPYRGDADLPREAGANPSDRIRWQHLYTPIPDVRSINPEIPDGLARAVQIAMAKDPLGRFPSVQAMADAISQAVGARFENLPDRVRFDGDSWPTQYGQDPGRSEPVPPMYLPDEHPWPETIYPQQLRKRRLSRRMVLLLASLLVAAICMLAAGGLARAFGRDLPFLPAWPTQDPAQATQPGLLTAEPTSAEERPTQPEPEVEDTQQAAPTQVAATPILPGQGQVAGEVVIVRKEQGRDRLFLLNLGSGEQVELPGVANVQPELAHAPQWSQDGSRLAFSSRYQGRTHIAVVDMQELEPYQLPAAEAYGQVSSPAWLPGGQEVGFWASGGGSNWLVVADAVSGDLVDQVELQEYRNLFAWNPSGESLAFTRQNAGLYEIALSGSTRGGVDWVIESGGEEYAPAWSPDGEWVAFQSDAGRGRGENEIWIARADGSEPRRLTNSPERTWSRAPTWSPDGGWIAFVANYEEGRGGDYGELYAVEVSSGKVIQLTESDGQVYDWRPAWRP